MTENRGRISKRRVDEIEPPAVGEVWFWDDKLAGFFVRAYASGRKVYAVKYRMAGKQRIFTIGAHGSPWAPDKARERAEAVLRDVGNGIDPGQVKKEEKAALTVSELIDRYIADGPATKPDKRASSWISDASLLSSHIDFLIGRTTANKLSKAEAANAIKDIAEGKTARTVPSVRVRGRGIISGGEGAAARTRSVASAMFNWGMEHGFAKQNPFSSIRMSKAPVRERFLNNTETEALVDAIASLEAEGEITSAHGDVIRMLLLTGARKTEISDLRWSEVDFDRSRLVLPIERTKAGGKSGERYIVLMASAVELLRRRRDQAARDQLYVFPAGRKIGDQTVPVDAIRRSLIKITARAGIAGLRPHDLRHTFASFAIADGASLFIVSKLLGHANTRTTERYLHLTADPLQELVSKIGSRMGTLGGVPSVGGVSEEATDA